MMMERIGIQFVGESISGMGILGILIGCFYGGNIIGINGIALVLVTLCISLIGSCFYFFYKWNKQDSLLFEIERDPIIKISTSANNVPVSVYGKIVPDQKLLRSPHSKTPCVFFHCIKEQYVKSGDSSYWKIIENSSNHIPFSINDGSGSIFVSLRNVDTDLGKFKIIKNISDERFIDYENSEVDALKVAYQQELERDTNWLGFKTGDRIRVSEYVLKSNENIFVHGWIYQDKSIKYIAESEKTPLIVSRKTKEDFIEDFAIGEKFFYTNNVLFYLGIIIAYYVINYFIIPLNIIYLTIGLALVSIKMMIQVYNRMNNLYNRIKNTRSQIDIEIKKRHDLIPELNKIVNAYSKYEINIIKDISSIKKYYNNTDRFDTKIFAIIENYPKLMASANFKRFAEELSKLENNIAYYRGFNNKTILKYNTLIATIPFNLIAKLTGFKKQEYVKTK